MGSIVNELHRRRVFRVALVYIVSAWVVIQVASEAFPGLGIPEIAIRYVWLGVMLGFPIALVFGWFYDITAKGLVRTPPADPARDTDLPLRKWDYGMLAVMVLVLTAIAVQMTARIRLLQPQVEFVDGEDAIVVVRSQDRSGEAAPTAQVTMAVLPFADLSPESDQQYFADGVHEEIISRLSTSQSFDVVSRTSVMAYRDTTANIRLIGAELGAGAVIEGSVRFAGDKVRITAQLIDTRDDTHLWTRSFDRDLTLENLFAIQDEIAEQIALGLNIQLQNDKAALPTSELGAYDSFLLGKYHYREFTPDDLLLSVQHFETAVQRDPGFIDAWDWLAYAWNHAGVQQGWTTPSEAYPKARAAAVRALELDPGLATARALLAFLRAVYDWEWEAALVDLEHAVRADPTDSGTVWSYAYVLSLLGRHDDAIRQVESLADSSIEEPRLRQQVAYRLNDAGRYFEAITAALKALELGADAGQIEELLGLARFGLGDMDQAMAHFESAIDLRGRYPEILGQLAATFARAGQVGQARDILAELEHRRSSSHVSPVILAQIHAALGELDRAIALLQEAVNERDRGVLWVGQSPFFDNLRGDPRLQQLVTQIGLPMSH
ncbi:MAG: hypothetical protein KJO31_04555 [Gammaproteobacteria bacterium]|nr:hypothetical protein [Gammaproteobacteria bacterium]